MTITIPHMTLETRVETHRPFNIAARKIHKKMKYKNRTQLPLTYKQQVHAHAHP